MSRIAKISTGIPLGLALLGSVAGLAGARTRPQAQAAPLGYGPEAYNAFNACKAMTVPEQEIGCLDTWMGKSSKSDTGLLFYVYAEYFKAYPLVKDYPKAVDACDKLLSLPNLDPITHYQILLARAQNFVAGMKTKELSTPQAVGAARDAARQGLKDWDTLKKPDTTSQADWDKSKRDGTGYLWSVVAQTSSILKDLPAVIQAHKSTLGLDPLSRVQIEQLLRLGTPDPTLAGEIRVRGIAFTPTKADVDSFRRLGAGMQTVQALDELRPLLEEAKAEIPEIVTKIYQALNKGTTEDISSLLGAPIGDDPKRLGYICERSSYRGHYIESIGERPGKRFEVHVRVLFQPLDEIADVLIFRRLFGRFVLTDVEETPKDWFAGQFKPAEDQARRFVYAMNQGNSEIANGLLGGPFSDDRLPDLNLKSGDTPHREISEVQVKEESLYSHMGLKIFISLGILARGTRELSLYLLLDPSLQPPKIVAWTYGLGFDAKGWIDAPNVEATTLSRFGVTSSKTVMPVAGSNGISLPQCIRCPRPDYPDDARRKKIQGTVWLEFVVDANGYVQDARVTRGVGHGLDEKALQAIFGWQFKPSTRNNGRPVTSLTTISVDFQLF
jgi:TonB family protein